MRDTRYFSNHYGINIVQNEWTYGLEAAVLSWWTDKDGVKHSSINYTSGITDDVVGNLDNKSLDELIEQIKALPDRGNEEQDDTYVRINEINNMGEENGSTKEKKSSS